LNTGEHMLPPTVDEIHQVMLEHLHDLYAFYGDLTGMRVARKHISWYTKGLSGSAAFRHNMNTLQTIDLQLQAINDFFAELRARNERLVYADNEDSDTENNQELAA
jgi:tRNA-dihydrouridine synthase B